MRMHIFVYSIYEAESRKQSNNFFLIYFFASSCKLACLVQIILFIIYLNRIIYREQPTAQWFSRYLTKSQKVCAYWLKCANTHTKTRRTFASRNGAVVIEAAPRPMYRCIEYGIRGPNGGFSHAIFEIRYPWWCDASNSHHPWSKIWYPYTSMFQFVYLPKWLVNINA